MSTTDDVTLTTETSCYIGRVKWFNNKAGYGFITVTDGEKSGSDIFVHHSSINVENQQYKYLVQGEYVQFTLVQTNGGKHEFQASNVSGINAGKLMCETRLEFKLSRSSYKNENHLEETTTMPKQVTPKVRREAPRRDSKDKDWGLVNSLVKQKKESVTKSRTKISQE